MIELGVFPPYVIRKALENKVKLAEEKDELRRLRDL
jgi:hypothetical protein